MTVDYLISQASIPAWFASLACLTPAVWRTLNWRGRYLDPIWCVVFLLALNRLSFLTHVSAVFSHATALILALAMAYYTVLFQRRDAA